MLVKVGGVIVIDSEISLSPSDYSVNSSHNNNVGNATYYAGSTFHDAATAAHVNTSTSTSTTKSKHASVNPKDYIEFVTNMVLKPLAEILIDTQGPSRKESGKKKDGLSGWLNSTKKQKTSHLGGSDKSLFSPALKERVRANASEATRWKLLSRSFDVLVNVVRRYEIPEMSTKKAAKIQKMQQQTSVVSGQIVHYDHSKGAADQQMSVVITPTTSADAFVKCDKFKKSIASNDEKRVYAGDFGVLLVTTSEEKKKDDAGRGNNNNNVSSSDDHMSSWGGSSSMPPPPTTPAAPETTGFMSSSIKSPGYDILGEILARNQNPGSLLRCIVGVLALTGEGVDAFEEEEEEEGGSSSSSSSSSSRRPRYLENTGRSGIQVRPMWVAPTLSPTLTTSRQSVSLSGGLTALVPASCALGFWSWRARDSLLDLLGDVTKLEDEYVYCSRFLAGRQSSSSSSEQRLRANAAGKANGMYPDGNGGGGGGVLATVSGGVSGFLSHAVPGSDSSPGWKIIKVRIDASHNVNPNSNIFTNSSSFNASGNYNFGGLQQQNQYYNYQQQQQQQMQQQQQQQM